MQYQQLEDSDTKGKINPAGGSVSLADGQALLAADGTPVDQEARRKKFIKWGIIGGIALIVIVLAIVLPLVLIKKGGNDNGHGPLPPGQMNPYSAQAGTQQAQGSGASVSGYLLSNLNQAELEKMAQKAIPERFVQFLQDQEDRKVKDTAKKVGVDWRNLNFFGPNNQLISNISYLIDVVAPSIARLVLTEGNSTRYSIPPSMVSANSGDLSMRLDMLGFHLYDEKSENFGFRFRDVTNNNVLLDTINQTLIFSDKYIQMDYKLPSQFVYGLGDRVHEFRLSEGAFNMWSSGQDGSYDDGRGRGGLSGVHPFVLVQTSNPSGSSMTPTRFIGMFFRNSNAMTPVLRYNDDGVTSTLSFITIGGQLEVYFIGQGTAHEVIQTYQQFLNLPKLVPYWSLGWQEATPAPTDCANQQACVANAAGNYISNGYPLDAVYMGADSWDGVNDFQLDAAKYPKIGDLSQILKSKNQRLVAYIDSAINVNDRTKNAAYKLLKDNDAFIKSTINVDNVDGYLLNSKQGKTCVYLDWLNPKAVSYWGQLVQKYQDNVPFDGLWTTMNEPYGDIAGEIAQNSLKSKLGDSEGPVQGDSSAYDQSWFYSFWPLNINSTYYLPFIPELKEDGNYDNITLSLNASHHNNNQDYDVHSLYPHGHMLATANTLKGDQRNFVLTRGSYASTNKYTPSQAHTNNARSWDSLYFGLQSVLRSQMFGMVHSGTDVCGYYSAGDTLDEELCLRWYQLATFFPLARHSQENNGPRTEPWKFKTYGPQVKKTMQDRMQYLRLLYTCMFQASDSGGTCIDPLQFQYYIPQSAWKAQPDFTNNFMVAGSLKVSPVMNATNGQATFSSYFPKGAWVNMADFTEIINGNDDYQNIKVRDTVNVHLAPGAAIPWQNNSDGSILTTADTFNKPISIVANRDVNGAAGMSLFLDQGISQAEMNNQMYEYYNINFQQNSIQVQGVNFNKGTQPHVLDQILIVNAPDLNETNFACYFPPNSIVPQKLQAEYLGDNLKTLKLTPLTPGLKFSQILNVYYGSSNKNDLNICDQHSFDYNIIGGVIPDLTQAKNVTFQLQHKAQTLDNITFYIGFHDNGIINVKYTWMNQSASKRVPLPVPNSIVDTTPKNQDLIQDNLAKYVNITDQPFTVTFKVKLTTAEAEPILSIKGLIFDEYLNWINVQAYAQAAASEDKFRGIFGLGEGASTEFFYKSGVYSLWAKDIDNPVEDGKLPGKNDYGVHPFYMFKHAKNSWVGVYHNSAQAQDWWINNDFTTGQISLSTVSTGGLGDLYIFLSAQKPESIISKYHSLIGQPVLVPQWALGWNQCRWCYRDLADVQQSMQGYIEQGIPLDTQWVDIDYMQDYKDFTYAGKDPIMQSPGSFSGLPDFVNKLHSMNMRFVPIIDAGVSYRPNQGYQAFDQGMQQDVFMKVNGNTFVGKVWPNEAAYPDFFAPNAESWWGQQLDSFQQTIPFDGLWQDMNEASNFCNGACHGDQLVASPISEKLRYTPTGESLETKSISLDVKHYNNYTQLDAHSLFGTQQVKASHEWFKKNNKRTMIISRSSFAGMGKYGSKWLGDNHATVQDMEMSVISVMNMNMFGIPLIGSDICGFGGPSTTPELCARWHSVGAFYPFSRNHRACWGDAQEPWRFNNTIFDGKTTYTDLMRKSIQRKYSLIRYYYTQMSQISYGNNTFYMMYKPVFFEFPEDDGAYHDIANNVMIGPAIKTSVNAKSLTQNMTDFYFPAGTWCSLFDNTVGQCIYNEFGQNVSLSTRLNESYAHLREGYIIPMQNAEALKPQTTADLQKAPIDLHVLGSYSVPGIMSWRADGQYVNDDGITLNVVNNVNQYRFGAQYTQSKVSGEALYITVSLLMNATNYYNASNGCSAVNNADWLQNVYVYNATSFKQHDSLWASVSYISDPDTYYTIGSANYDAATNRIVYDGSANWICLSSVFRIAFRNLNPAQ